jgi:CRP/FNR family cyclic AMP-dependent transcriptional regulator
MPSQSRPPDRQALVDALPPVLAALAQRGVARAYPKDTLLIHEGDVGDSLYIVLAGRLRVFSVDDQQGREITYGTYGAGEYVGEFGLDGGARAASVITLEPSVCALVTRATLQAHIAARPEFAFELLAKVIRRARAATLTARQLALNDVYGRVKLQLEALAERMPDGRLRIPERLTHREMASRAGCSREMISRVLKDLETGGYVTLDDGCLVLLRALPPRW